MAPQTPFKFFRSSSANISTEYISSLDGLRAVAVILVLFYHAGFGFASGGFIGVDVFFVISGFLITRNIVRDLAEGRWSFQEFYARRIARLLPALFVTILATFFAAIFILSPNDLERLGRVGIYTSLSSSNVFFWLESGYFSQGVSTKPVLHTWSLGVEEQFYLIWPLFIYALSRVRKFSAGMLGVSIVGTLSLGAAIYLAPNFPSAVFFLTPFRIYQFALGAILAFGPVITPGKYKSLVGCIAVIGLLIITAKTSGDSGNIYTNALAPAVCGAAFIWAAKARSITIVFASSLFRWIGQRSYSIYLVHWPIMVLWPMATDFQLSAGEGSIAIIGAIAAGSILYSTVEKRLRFTPLLKAGGRRFSLGCVAMFAGLSLVSGAHLWGLDGLPKRVPETLLEIAGNMNPVFQTINHNVGLGKCYLTKQHELSDYDVDVCANPVDGKRSYYIIGDSLSAGIYMAFQEAYPDIYFGYFGKPGCVLRLPSGNDLDQKKPFCKEYYELAFSLSLEKDFDGVIFATNWLPHQDGSITDFTQWARENGLDPIIIGHRARFRERVRDVMLSSMSLQQAENKMQLLLMKKLGLRAKKLLRDFGDTEKIVDIYSIQCPDHCPIVDGNNNILYYDGHHLTPSGASWVAVGLRENYPHLFIEQSLE